MIDQEDIQEKVEEILEESPERNFTESIDLAINLKNIDLSDPNNRIDEEIVLPNGIGKGVKVCVVASGDMAVKAENVADKVMSEEELEELEKDKSEARKMAKKYDFFLAEAPLMPKIGRVLGPILGPRGKMPNPVQPGEEIEPKIKKLKNTIQLRSGERKTFHSEVGSLRLGEEEISENIRTILRRLDRKLPMGRQNIHSIYVKTTMGPSKELV